MKRHSKENLTQSTVFGLDERLPMTVGTLTVTVALESIGETQITLTISQGGVFPSDTTPAILMQVAGNAIASWVEISKHTLSTFDENTETVSSKILIETKEKLPKTSRIKPK